MKRISFSYRINLDVIKNYDECIKTSTPYLIITDESRQDWWKYDRVFNNRVNELPSYILITTAHHFMQTELISKGYNIIIVIV